MFRANKEAKTGINQYEKYLGRRYPTFRLAFDLFRGIGGKTIVELGTTRSFVSGGLKGCMLNDRRYWYPKKPKNWDWGGGIFTRMCALELEDIRPAIHSVDISPDAIAISKITTEDFSHLITYHLMSSEDFLSSFEGKIDLLYMDAGETKSGADELHLREAHIVVRRQLISENGIVLIDDVNVPNNPESKGRLSIPYLCAHGFVSRMAQYQVLLQLQPT